MSQLAGPAVQQEVSSVGEVQDVVRDAASRGVALRVAGAGTWLRAGRPVDAASTVVLRPLRGIVDYTPGDLTITAWAGTSLEELDDAVAEHAQWIALDPFGGRRGTLGATVATASHGPLAASFGTPRDVVLGVQCVTGDGEVVHGGARVVKHVAGFDLVRLMTGAWGTLGVITQLTVRLRARAPVDVTYAVTPGATSLRDWWPAYRAASVTPLAAELLSAGTARTLGVGQEMLLLVRVAGNDEAVSAQADALRSLGAVHGVAPDVWTRFADSDPSEPVAALRLSQRIKNVAAAWDDAMALAADALDARVHATVDRGVVRIVFPHLPEKELTERLQRTSTASTRVVEVLPATLWPRLAPSSARDALSTRIRAAFDPERRLNRGILGEA
ncbi:MAG: FAD-binding oxidoreductase [Gemmatimonadota bacterium]